MAKWFAKLCPSNVYDPDLWYHPIHHASDHQNHHYPPGMAMAFWPGPMATVPCSEIPREAVDILSHYMLHIWTIYLQHYEAFKKKIRTVAGWKLLHLLAILDPHRSPMVWLEWASTSPPTKNEIRNILEVDTYNQTRPITWFGKRSQMVGWRGSFFLNKLQTSHGEYTIRKPL